MLLAQFSGGRESFSPDLSLSDNKLITNELATIVRVAGFSYRKRHDQVRAKSLRYI
jgi:hypothetical protein